MKIRLLSILLILSLCLVCFAACDSDDKKRRSKSDRDSGSDKNSETVEDAETELLSEPQAGIESDEIEGDETEEKSDPFADSESETNAGTEDETNTDGGDAAEKQYVRDGDYIYFGEWPQSIKAEGVTVTQTVDERGYYLGSDGAYYAKVEATPCASGYQFSTGAVIKESTGYAKQYYYFKVEPIRWRILTEDSMSALILCDSIIAAKPFDDYDGSYSMSNSFAESDIRAWLNDEFYNTAFSKLAQEIVITVYVDNSALGTGFTENSFACEDTWDKVFLLSFANVINPEYGFYADADVFDAARMMCASDYARATGAWIFTDGDGYGNGKWWLRSPADGYSTYVRDVTHDGTCSTDFFYDCNSKQHGIVPAIIIKLG